MSKIVHNNLTVYQNTDADMKMSAFKISITISIMKRMIEHYPVLREKYKAWAKLLSDDDEYVYETRDANEFYYAIDFAVNVHPEEQFVYVLYTGSFIYALHDILHGIHDVNRGSERMTFNISKETEAERFFQAKEWADELGQPVSDELLTKVEGAYLCFQQAKISFKERKFSNLEPDEWKSKCL